jgi:hypothetical protein
MTGRTMRLAPGFMIAVLPLAGLGAGCSHRSTGSRSSLDGGQVAEDTAAESRRDQDAEAEGRSTEDVGPRRMDTGGEATVPIDGSSAADAPRSEAICSSGGWCWTNPLPACGLAGSWSYSQNDAWLVGRVGLILRWRSGGWFGYETGTTANLRAVWGLDTQAAWAVGEGGTILHWNSIRWVLAASPVKADLNAVFGTAPDDVWAVGAQGTVIHWDGVTWTSLAVSDPTATLHGVWAASRTRAWAVGTPGVFAWDGTTWSKTLGFSMLGIWGTSESDVWVVGPPDSSEYPAGRTSHAHWDGTRWTFAPEQQKNNPTSSNGPALTSVWGKVAGAAWATTNAYAWVARFDTQTLTMGSIPDNPASMTGAKFGGGTGGFVFATSIEGIAQFDGADWVMRSTGVFGNIDGIWMRSPSDGWAILGGSVAHWDGRAWSMAATSPLGTAFHAISGTASDDVWAVGALGVVMHWDGKAWMATKLDGPSYINHVWGSSSRDVWATATEPGRKSALLHYDGAAWTVGVTTPMAAVGGVWGTAANDVWVGSESGYVLHWDGLTWTATAT